MKHLSIIFYMTVSIFTAYAQSSTCEKITRKVDDFTNEITISSPIFDQNEIQKMIAMRFITKSKTDYYLDLYTIGHTVNVSISGVIILFTDGSKITKPTAEVDVEVHDDGYQYRSFITLNQSDLQHLTTKEISKFRLYIYDQSVSPEQANRFKNYVGCLLAGK